MKLRNLLAATAVALLAATSGALIHPSPAMAVDASGSNNLAAPNGRGIGIYYIDYDNNTVRVAVDTNTLEAGKCVTLYLDSARATGVLETNGSNTHLDPWIARSCKSNTGRSSGTQYAGSTYGINLIRPLQTLAVCYGYENTLKNGGSCNVYAGTAERLSNVATELYHGMPCGQGYLATASGGAPTYDTGHWTRCDL